ncbi:MAG: hypothetical protein FWH51_01940 [Dehalococcoidia bacterium]|nr:hypothetical protein [Dehalococcoidia bacterium]
MIQIIEMELGRKYSIAKITEILRKVSCSHLDQNVWLFDYADKATEEMNAVFNTDFGKKCLALKQIKENIGDAKKNPVTL